MLFRSVVVSHDTGFLHIATAFKKPTITLWGATSPALQFEAYYPKEANIPYYNAIVSSLHCQPCSKQGDNHCPQGHFACMRLQNVNGIAAKAKAFYKGSNL